MLHARTRFRLHARFRLAVTVRWWLRLWVKGGELEGEGEATAAARIEPGERGPSTFAYTSPLGRRSGALGGE